MDEFSPYQRAPQEGRRPNRAGLVILLLILIFAVSVVGGAVGFVMLSTDSAWARNLRQALHVDNLSNLNLPTSKQTVRLEESSAVIDASSKVSPAVVSISAMQQVQDFYGRVSSQEVAGGSGFILTSDGLIVTNRHVVSTPGTYKVVLSDGRILDATIKAVDSFNDLAIVKVDAKDLPTVELGSSDDLKIGQSVIAIGNALGEFKNSVTYGVVSAKSRTVDAGGDGVNTAEHLTDLIQTDAAINPGNSGGPLVNLRGQVVGINTLIATNGSNGSIGVGFAISIDSIKSVLDSVRKTGEIIRPYLGVRFQTVDKTLQQLNNLSVDYGALVTRGSSADELAVIPGSPADKAGIKENDIILEVNGERVDSDNPLPKRLQKYNVGQEITLKIQRGTDQLTVKATLDKLQNTQ